MSLRSALIVLPLLFAAPAWAADPAPVSALVSKVNIPYKQFTLPNGLRVVVHTDRKAPVVAVSVWYHIGSKDEPKGKTGFAHLFEHLMFNGSENAREDIFKYLQQIGATDVNGTTWYDRTNYFQTVPTGALETALFLESDRMGFLLGAVTQQKLDTQRGVVQNEKRQGDNEPFGTAGYIENANLFPVGHPYRHSTIGSMADLNSATLDDVKSWFRANYGASNAVLVLAGDIDVPTARRLTTKWFGKIARGPAVARIAAPIPTLPASKSVVIKDRVPYTRLSRHWVVEGVNGRDTVALKVAASVLGGLSSSRLDNALVRGEQTAIGVSAGLQQQEKLGFFEISANVKPGQDPAKVAARLDAIIADFIKNGPTEDEVRRVATKSLAGTIGGYESVGGFGGKAVALAEGLVYSGDPGKYKKDLAALAAVTPASVKAAMAKWLTRPVLNVTVEPGERDTSPAMLALTGDDVEGRAPPPPAPVASAPVAATRTSPPVGTLAALDFPGIERTTLANGIKVYFARRPEIPVVRVSVSFDAGSSADPANRLGVQALTMSLLDEGTTTKTSTQIAEVQERLGATVSSGGSVDRSSVGLYALTPNLPASLDLLADVVRNPAFDAKEVERLRNQQAARIASQLTQPTEIARAVLPAKIYGAAHPYGRPAAGLGDAATVATFTRDDVVRFQRDWLQPSKAEIYVVGDTTMAALKPLLEARFGNWAEDRMARPVKDFSVAVPPAQGSRIYLVDRPGSPQSFIYGGQVTGGSGKDPALTVLRQANDVMGGNFLSRMNTDLRETKGWSYGVGSGFTSRLDKVAFVIQAPVQTDKTGPSIAALISNMRDYLGAKGTTPEELDRTTNGSIRELPGSFETSDSVLGGLISIVQLDRPDDYYETIAAKYRAMTAADFDKAARGALDPDKLAFVVVGDAAKVRPQLDALGLPIETVQLPVAK